MSRFLCEYDIIVINECPVCDVSQNKLRKVSPVMFDNMAENIQNDDNELFHNKTAFIILHMVACTKDNRDWLHVCLQLDF